MGLFRKKKPEPRKPEPAFKADVAEVESFKVMLKGQKCPGCEQVGLVLRSFERGPEGFEARITCDNCGVYGTVNTVGFNFQRLGKTKGEVAKLPVVMR
jgi:hypothetical protein